MLNLIVINFITISMIIGLLLQLATGKLFEKKIERLFFAGIIIIFFLVIFDIVDFYLASQSEVNNFRYVSSIIGYILRPTALSIFITILLRNRKSHYLLWVPVVIIAIILISNPFNHIVFYFDQYNEFQRGPLGYMPHIFSGFYMGILLFAAIKKFRIVDKAEIMTIVYIVILCSVATSLETIFGLKFLLPGAMVNSCTIYYIYLYVQVYKLDVMTGLPNRRSFYMEANKNLNNTCVIISIDLNGLKFINDSRGHAAGDLAIKAIAKTASDIAGNEFHVYRTGGDEFMVMGINKQLDDAEYFIDIMKAKLNDTEYSASYGAALYSPDKDFNKVCVEADLNMYNDKKNSKNDKPYLN